MTAPTPNQFHFVFGLERQNQPLHLLHYLALESCRLVNRPDRIFFHYKYEPFGEYWDRIKEHLKLARVEPPSRVTQFRYSDPFIATFRYAHESDFVRLDVLIEHGGVYADMDTLFVNPIPRPLFDHPFVLGAEEDVPCRATGTTQPSLCNALIMCQPGAEFARLWRREMDTAFDGSWSRHSTLLPHDLATRHPDLIHVEPARTFYKYMWTRKDLRRLFEECEPADPAVASIHLWAHLWWSETRRDFSHFHAGLITEDRIRRVDTTFYRLARPFLPPERKGARTLSRLMARLKRRPARFRIW